MLVCGRDMILTSEGCLRPVEIQEKLGIKPKILATNLYVFGNGVKLHLPYEQEGSANKTYKFFRQRKVFALGVNRVRLAYLHQLLKAYGIKVEEPGGSEYYVRIHNYVSEEEKEHVHYVKRYIEEQYHYWARERREFEIVEGRKMAYIRYTDIVYKFKERNIPLSDIPIEVRTGDITTLLSYIKPFIQLFRNYEDKKAIFFNSYHFALSFFNLLYMVGLFPELEEQTVKLSKYDFSVLLDAVEGKLNFTEFIEQNNKEEEIEPISVHETTDQLFFDIPDNIYAINTITVRDADDRG